MDFAVYIDRAWDFNNTYHQNYKDVLDYLENSVVKANGYVIAIMNDRVLNHKSGSRYELIKVIRDNISTGKETPNIIPIVMQDSITELIRKDMDLSMLSMWNILYLEGLDINTQ